MRRSALETQRGDSRHSTGHYGLVFGVQVSDSSIQFMRTDLVPVTHAVWRAPKRSGVSALHMIWRRRRVVLVTAFVVAAFGAAVVRKLPSVYRAETVILVESQRIPERFVPPTVSNELNDRLATLSQQILSYSRLLEIVDRYDLYRDQRAKLSREEIVEIMRDDVGINLDQRWASRGRGDSRPSAFRISYQGSNPELVALVANQLGGLFIDENLRAREVQAVGTSEFLSTQLVEAKKRLEEQETKLSAYKVKFNGELPEQENILVATLGQLQSRFQAANDAIVRAEQTKTILEASVGAAADADNALFELAEQAAVPPASSPAVAGAEPESLLLEGLRRRIEVAKGVLGESHPEMIAMREQLDRLQREEKGTPDPHATGTNGAAATPAPETTRRKPVTAATLRLSEMRLQRQERLNTFKTQISAVKEQIQTASAERDRLSAEINRVQQRLGRIPIREQELTVVRRDYEMSRAHYQSLLDKGMSADLAAEMERRQKAERFTIIDAARAPSKPVKPNRLVLYALAGIMSMVFGVVAAYGTEARRNVLLGDWDVPKGLPVLGRIPPIITTRPLYEIPRQKMRRKLVRLSAIALLLLFTAAAAAAYYFDWIPSGILARLHG